MKYCINTKTNKVLCIFTNENNCYKIKVDKVTESAQDLRKLCKMGGKEEILNACDIDLAKEVSVITKMGYIKTSLATEYSSARTNTICKLNEQDQVLAVGIDKKYLLMETSTGKKLNIVANEKITGRATKGCKAISMAKGELLVNANFTNKEPSKLGKRGQNGKSK